MSPTPDVGKVFWTRIGEAHVCWRHAVMNEGYGYQRLGEYRRVREQGLYRALKTIPPSALPTFRDFDNEDEAKRWIES